MSTIPAALSALCLLAGLSYAAWSWGQLLLRSLGQPATPAYAAVVGLSVLIVVGGWINLAGLAYPPTLVLVLATSWAVGVTMIRRERRAGTHWVFDSTSLTSLGLIGLVGIGIGIHLLPSGVFNIHDDLSIYVPRPVRMLQTGSLGGDPYDPIGFDTLGGHAWLQSFVLIAHGPQFLPAFDSVLCVLLSMAVLTTVARQAGLGAGGIAAVLVTFIVLHLQPVNITSVYGTTMFLLALILASPPLLDAGQVTVRSQLRVALVPGLLVAALATLRISNAMVLAPAALVLLGALVRVHGLRRSLGLTLSICLVACLALAPWLLLHIDKFLQPWRDAMPMDVAPKLGEMMAALTSTAELVWGGNAASYTALVALAFSAPALALWRTSRRGLPEPNIRMMFPLSMLCSATAIAFVIISTMCDARHTIRYSAPFLAAAVPASILIFSISFSRPTQIPLAALAILAFLFGGVALDRLDALSRHRSPMLFQGSLPRFEEWSTWSFSTPVQDSVRAAQARTEAGSTVLALISYPHHLWFARNRIFLASEFAVSTPWHKALPVDAQEAISQLRNQGIRYVLWHPEGGFKHEERLLAQLESPYYQSRKLAQNLLSFRRALKAISARTGPVYSDIRIELVDLEDR